MRNLPSDLQHISEAQLESAEAFTSRFARTVDLSYCRERKPALDAICDRVRDYVSRLPG